MSPPDWHWSRCDRLGSSVRLRCVHAVSAREAWVAGAGGTVLRTRDSGRSWVDLSPTGTQDDQLRAVAVLSPEVVVVLAFGEDGRILRTTDGGATWHVVYRTTTPRLFLNCLVFDAAGNGLALADPVDGRFRLIGSTDRGQTWQELSCAGMPPAEEGETSFAASGTALVSVGHGYRFVTGGSSRARVFRAPGYGAGWQVSPTSFPAGRDAGLFSVAFAAGGRGVAVGGDYHRQDQVLGDTSSPADLSALPEGGVRLTTSAGTMTAVLSGGRATLDVVGGETATPRSRFDLHAWTLEGSRSALAEVVRRHLYETGMRFTRQGYELPRRSLADLVDAGLEESG